MAENQAQSQINVNSIGRVTEEDIQDALHDVVDPELGIDVVDLGLVYGIEIDELGRAIITMTLTTPACPLTDLIEDECASALVGLVDEFRIDWTWKPRWSVENITEDGRAQLEALGYNLNNLPASFGAVIGAGAGMSSYAGGISPTE
ncbi:metal-sulfur cluster biosynthetic enzyme [Gardnerella vaginalis]|uniref:metal-sulfur cluster assembly factor n=1 Tax=Gardnerella vaginalis TaxID=2702 RepID=UPI0006606DF7|nr:metal-sulfur cluster assembly factor [Gardnerella vaginalis]KMT46729.1 metal-sulfur cluster biosynthetic enzyme [Gardnerella vaginalis]MDK7260034.1 metal-sulfur cluster assembly factor [Gardnerella vaginalis]MDK8776335.1 metal-sulfur cluster assembly factor [Gardnerella vaginalis]NSX24685.1 metal-sulfur cluster assembly factor [Gardnerella vaginalis]PKY97633.1 metal-sulfur cluster assembly factor [Gardnerella vaginalis]